MSIRISATYAATDGSMPEQVEVEWSEFTPELPGTLVVILDRLFAAPRERPTLTDDGADRA